MTKLREKGRARPDTIDLRGRESASGQAEEDRTRQDMPADDGRGRQADAPHEIPAQGWKDVAVRVKDEARRDNLSLVAGGVGFFSLLSLAPALAAVVSIYGLVASPQTVTQQINNLAGTLPEDARRLLNEQMNQVVSANGAALGVSAVIGIVIALWGASAAMKHLIVALSSMYDEEETRKFVALRGRALLLTVGAIAFMGVVIGLLAGIPAWLDSRGWSTASSVVSVVRWPAIVVFMMAALAVLYRFAPDRDEPKWRWTSWGAGIATAAWLLASIGFSIYATNFGSYNKTYGSMAAVVVMMLWLYITAACVLLGAEINAELERQTTKDSTKGADQPMGQRQATVADTVGDRAGAKS